MHNKTINRDNINIIYYVIILTSLVITLSTLNRWWTDQNGYYTLGRVWQYYVSYFEFGFVRRAFISTIVDITHLDSIVKNEYIVALVMHHISILGMYALILIFFNKYGNNFDIYSKFVVLLSPSFLMQSAYTTSSQDVFILVFVLLNCLFVRNKYIFSIIIIMGALTHELFIFTIPAQMYILYKSKCDEGSFIQKKALTNLIVPAIASIAIYFIISRYGVLNLDQSVFENMMRIRMPNADYTHAFWSGYFELSANFSTYNKAHGGAWKFIWANIYYILFAMSYVFLLIYLYILTEDKIINMIIGVVAILFPLLITFVAIDFYRWIGWSAKLALFLMMSNGKRRFVQTPMPVLIPMVAFAILAPMGSSDIWKPFPLRMPIINWILSCFGMNAG